MDKALLVGLGGFAGAVGRYLLNGWLSKSGTFPWGTLAANTTGCFLIGLLAAATIGRFALPPNLRLALLTGFLGAFTTFSAFSYETLVLFQGERSAAGFGNIAMNLLGCMAAVWAGAMTGKIF